MFNNESMENSINKIKQSVTEVINQIPMTEKMMTKDFVARVVADTSMDRTTAVGIISLCIKNNDKVVQRPGRNGGIFRVKQ